MTTASTVITSTTPLWYATRATGVVALVLLTMSVVLGIMINVRFATERWPRFVTIGIHRNLSLLVITFLGLHIATAFSLTAKVPMIYLHPRKDGQGEVIEGVYVPGQTVLVIDDLITGGTSVIETANQLRDAGLQVKDAVVLVDRKQGAKERLKSHGIRLIPILELETLLNWGMTHGRIADENAYRASLDYLHRQADEARRGSA